VAPAINEPIGLPTVELLTWISSRSRTYSETIDAWRSNCPRLSVWEDALADGLVAVRNGDGAAALQVTLTARGKAALGATTAGQRAAPTNE
jgi:hypothetical protein